MLVQVDRRQSKWAEQHLKEIAQFQDSLTKKEARDLAMRASSLSLSVKAAILYNAAGVSSSLSARPGRS